MLPVNATKHATRAAALLPSASHCLDHLSRSAQPTWHRPRQRKYLKTETENRK